MYCRGCGVHAPDEANFCVSCGSDLRRFREDEYHDLDDPTLDDLDPVSGEDDGPEDTTAAIMSEPDPTSREAGSEDLRVCPRCESRNSPQRYLCGRCGANLETGDGGATAVVPNPASATRTRSRHLTSTDDLERSRSSRRWRFAAAVVSIGVVVGGLLGAMIVLGLGPFASSGEAASSDAPVFDRSAYPDQPSTLRVASVAATTTRTGGDGEFTPIRMLDGEITTAWNSRGEVNPDGVGEVIEVDFTEPVWLSQIVFAIGDQEDDGTYVANARPKKVEVELDGGARFIAHLIDQPGEQAIRLPIPRFTSEVRFEVTEVYPGDTYEDLAISEIEFRGYVANAEDAASLQEDAAGAP